MSRSYPSKQQELEANRTLPGAPVVRSRRKEPVERAFTARTHQAAVYKSEGSAPRHLLTNERRADNVRQQQLFKLGGTPGRKLMTGAVRKDKKHPNDYASTRENDQRRKQLFKESAAPVVRPDGSHYSNKGVTIGTQLHYVDNSTRNVSVPEPGQWLDVSGWTDEECRQLGDIIAASFAKNPALPRAFARDLARPSDGLVDILRKAHCPPALMARLFHDLPL